MTTLQKLKHTISPISISSVRAFLVSLFRSLGNGRDSQIREARCSLRSAESYMIKDPAWSYWKMSKVYSTTKEEELFTESSSRFKNWGMWDNGKFLTAKISVSHRTGNECSLSDILEEEVDPKYFLSQKAMDGVMSHMKRHKEKGNGFGATVHHMH